MSLVATGDSQVLLQSYKYNNLSIICTFNIYPIVYDLHDQKQVDYHWMTASRWSLIEHGLRRHFDGTPKISINAAKLQAEMQSDHMKIEINVTSKKCLSAIRQMLHANEALGKEELVALDIGLHYVSHENIIIKESYLKSSYTSEKETTESRQSKLKQRSKQGKTVSSSTEAPNNQRMAVKVKRKRRSISQSDNRGENTQSTSTSKNGHLSRKDKPDKSSKSRANSVESVKPLRRSVRSPVQPQRFQNFVLGRKTSSKSITKNKTLEEMDSRPYKFEQLDGSTLDALQRLNSMLTTKAPRQVKILLLEHKSQSQILDTFNKYQSEFQLFFERREHKLHTANYLGIGHLEVMDLLSHSIQTSMIQKLGDKYSKKSSHGSLVINGLLPMWIIRLFMDEYKFLREEDAATHIKEQLKYATYLKALNNDPLASDLDD